MLTSLVEKYDIYFKQRDVQYMFMVIVAPSLILILTDVSGIQQKSDICQVQKNNLQILRHHKNTVLKEITSETYVFGDKMTKY